jgi:hypothetical protein
LRWGQEPCFYQQLLAEEYIYLALIPVFHLVLLVFALQTVGPMIDPAWPITNAALPLPVPEPWRVSAVAVVVAGAGGLSLSSKGMPSSMTGSLRRSSVADDEMAVPIAEAREKSEDAASLAIFEQAVSTLLIGETGSGKTSAMQLLAAQLNYDDQTAVIGHAFGGKLLTFFARELGFEVIRLEIEDSTVRWNLFLDIEKPRQFQEVASEIMGEPQGHDPFHGPATQALRDAMIYLQREGKREGTVPTHADLRGFFDQSIEEIHRSLDEQELKGARQIDPDTGGARNVLTTLDNRIDELFVGDFAEAGDFSLREYVENPAGRVVVIDSPQDELDTVGPMFKLMLDMSIRYGLTSETRTNYVLDEIDELPALSQLSTLASAGREAGVRALIGIQTKGQLEATYGSQASGIYGNCPQGIYFSPGDPETTDYMLEELGERRERVTTRTTGRSGSGTDRQFSSSRSSREVDRTPITSGELRQFDSGECVVVNRTEWWIGRVAQLENVRDEL